MPTNQEKLLAGLELHDGYKDNEAGERTRPQAYYPAVFFYKGAWYRIPTQSFKKYPKSQRIKDKRRVRRQKRREYLRSQGLKRKNSRSPASVKEA